MCLGLHLYWVLTTWNLMGEKGGWGMGWLGAKEEGGCFPETLVRELLMDIAAALDGEEKRHALATIRHLAHDGKPRLCVGRVAGQRGNFGEYLRSKSRESSRNRRVRENTPRSSSSTASRSAGPARTEAHQAEAGTTHPRTFAHAQEPVPLASGTEPRPALPRAVSWKRDLPASATGPRTVAAPSLSRNPTNPKSPTQCWAFRPNKFQSPLSGQGCCGFNRDPDWHVVLRLLYFCPSARRFL